MRLQVVGIIVYLFSLSNLLADVDRVSFVDCSAGEPSRIYDVFEGNEFVGEFSLPGLLPASEFSLGIFDSSNEVVSETELLLPAADPEGMIEFGFSIPENSEPGVYFASLQVAESDIGPVDDGFYYCAKFRFNALGGIIGNGFDGLGAGPRIRAGSNQASPSEPDASVCGGIRSSKSHSASFAIVSLMLILFSAFLILRRSGGSVCK